MQPSILSEDATLLQIVSAGISSMSIPSKSRLHAHMSPTHHLVGELRKPEFCLLCFTLSFLTRTAVTPTTVHTRKRPSAVD